MQKGIAILGSTGSIGTQTIEVCRTFPDRFKVVSLTAANNHEMLIEQALELSPEMVVIANENKYRAVKEALSNTGIKVEAGAQNIGEAAKLPSVDMVLAAIVGFAGLNPTIEAIEAGKDIAIANKETLVVAGDIVTNLAAAKQITIIPVDSEHSAIFQCLSGERTGDIEKLILTASGGPFRGMKTPQLKKVTKANALNHPNWSMGAKITIDSASLMNKGLEVIEAHWLFGVPSEKIEVIIHPQSIIHSMVQYVDGSIKAQLGLPDMRLPIQYALAYPERLPSSWPRFDFSKFTDLSFEMPDTNTFRNLVLAYEALKTGGNMPCVLNAANEIAVQTFLNDKVSFTGMSRLIEKAMEKIPFVPHPNYSDYIETDKITREYTQNLIK